MRELYICDTPYQVMNALNIAYHKKDSADKILFIENQFRTAEQLAERAGRTGIFKKVYLLRRDEIKFMSAGFKRLTLKIMLNFAPKMYMRLRLKDYAGECESVFDEPFNTIYASMAIRSVIAMLRLNRKAELIFFDDGTGSYSGEIITKGKGILYSVFSKVFHAGTYLCRPSSLFVNNIKMCRTLTVPKDRIFPLPEIDKGFIDFCGKIFGVNSEKRNYVFWLSQPPDSTPGASEARDKVRACLMPYRDKITVRMHPRDNDAEYYRDFTIDYGYDMWELSILSYNDKADSLILIASYSSAQTNPKILFDMEPVLIFLNHFNASTSHEEYDRIDSQIEDMRKVYRNPEKIYNPKTPEELSAVLQKIFS